MLVSDQVSPSLANKIPALKKGEKKMIREEENWTLS